MSDRRKDEPVARDGAAVLAADRSAGLAWAGRRVIPALTAEQMREVDRIMVEELHIELAQVMENAGRGLAALVLGRFRSGTVTLLAGAGGNGGGGLVAARHLANQGLDVAVTLSQPAAAFRGVPGHQLDIVMRMGIRVVPEPQPAAVVVDALIGYGLQGPPAGRSAELIDWANAGTSTIVALDVPSGQDATSGVAATPCINASATLTLALPKVGLLDAPQTGDLFLADISVPPLVYRRLGLSVPPLFGNGPIVAVTTRQRAWRARSGDGRSA
jgi:NAD(P)H-hydrate epimerase